ncbi:hypothetical protein AMTR_s00013p00252260 [Amborella trichopoda]|uniref:AP2/ERF domain-containing protein n=2 Tax=Amborella trichopoda TaxID=13333 RepID=W1PS23_AMBTC|nr:hypothetical protein AMTR_s00013p00252260 [Amborella trichopoda]
MVHGECLYIEGVEMHHLILRLFIIRKRVKLDMVSLRRRRLLGLSPGKTDYVPELPKFSEIPNMLKKVVENTKSLRMQLRPVLSTDSGWQKQTNISDPGSSNVSGCSSSKEEMNKKDSAGQEIKRRKRQRRKHFEDREECIMRGVYFKNMKWQAAIKVDKKQIHLGTVGSQEEAAHLYDRAAFMCGREPNFELSEEEKEELRRFNWDDFLTMTRNAITNKKHQKKIANGMRRKQATNMQPCNQSNGQAAQALSAPMEEGRHVFIS